MKHGTVHQTPKDMQRMLTSKQKMIDIWNAITPLARNEWICWIEDAKKVETRKRRIDTMLSKFLQGKKRPCCWAGCPHR